MPMQGGGGGGLVGGGAETFRGACQEILAADLAN